MIRVDPGTASDLPDIRVLVADAGLPLDGLGVVPTDFFVAREDDAVVGTAALEHHSGHGLLRSVVVAESHRGSGIGTRLVAAAERAARDAGLAGIYLLTETAEDFFAARGYRVIARDAGPAAVMSSVEWSEACSVNAVPMSLETIPELLDLARKPGSDRI